MWRLKKDRHGTSLSKAVSRTNQRRKKSKLTKEHREEQPIGGKDASLFLFRALGKILHCKRESYRRVSRQCLIVFLRKPKSPIIEPSLLKVVDVFLHHHDNTLPFVLPQLPHTILLPGRLNGAHHLCNSPQQTIAPSAKKW